MRITFSLALLALTMAAFSAPAMAGTLTFANGQATWQSTQCTEPKAPPSLLEADRHTPAEGMNVLMTQYNQYAQQMQAYMDCLSNEAQNDSGVAGQAIVTSARGIIDEAHQKVSALGATLQKK